MIKKATQIYSFKQLIFTVKSINLKKTLKNVV